MSALEATPAPAPVKLTVGSKVTFYRGMFGNWPGTIRKLYMGRTHGSCGWLGKPMALVSYTRKNGSYGTKRCAVEHLAPRP